MIEFCFTQLEYYLKQIKNSAEEYPFQQARQLVREKPDIDFITAHVAKDDPYCLISIADYKETPLGNFFDTYIQYEISDIIHTGTGTAAHQITGDHEGNNSYILKITAGGIIGTEPYPEYSLKINDGEFSTPQDIPGDGKIAIGDGTTFEFEVGSTVVTNDEYAWQTFALRINIHKEKILEIKFRVDIWAKTKQELFQTDGYFDQLSKLIIDRYVTDGVQVIHQSPGPSRWIQSEFEREHNLIHGALEISYTGAIYTTTEDALVCKLVMS